MLIRNQFHITRANRRLKISIFIDSLFSKIKNYPSLLGVGRFANFCIWLFPIARCTTRGISLTLLQQAFTWPATSNTSRPIAGTTWNQLPTQSSQELTDNSQTALVDFKSSLFEPLWTEGPQQQLWPRPNQQLESRKGSFYNPILDHNMWKPVGQSCLVLFC